MNNSEAIKKEYQIEEDMSNWDKMLPHLAEIKSMEITSSDQYMRFASEVVKLIIPDIKRLLSKARSEAFEEAIQALPEKDHRPTDEQHTGACIACGYDEAIDEIKEVLMKLKGGKS